MAESLIDARGFRLRLIAPGAGEGATQAVLGRTFGFTELPLEHLPDSAGLVDGSYTLRLGDSGEFTLRFPNAAGKKGLWRDLFDPDLALQFVELYRDDVLEFVGNVQRVEIDRGVVSVSGVDGWALLRRAYEKDRPWTAAPGDVIRAYTRVPLPLIADDFDSLSGDWTTGGTSTHSETVSGGLLNLTASGASPTSRVSQTAVPTGDTWRMRAVVTYLDGAGAALNNIFFFGLYASAGGNESVTLQIAETGEALATVTDGTILELHAAPAPNGAVSSLLPCTLEIERKGRWVGFFVNGKLLGFSEYRDQGAAVVQLLLFGDAGSSVTALVDLVVVEEETAFLAQGADLGDYVLPGDQPSGGLRGRYFNDADLSGLTAAARAAKRFAPNREPYAERLDATIDTAAISIPVQPGNSGDYFSVRWFGSVYLRLDISAYIFEITSVLDGVRMWVAQTDWGDQIVDDWTTGAGTQTVGPFGPAWGAEAGWYPIVLEYFCDTGTPAITLKFKPSVGYTDPGGTVLASNVTVTIPSTSLSPLGCFDNRVQGTTHFDIVQSAAQQFGYQLTCEPKQLETGEFPGLLVPRVRCGRDTDVVIETEDADRADPALSPGKTIDSSDQAVRVTGSGAGLPDGGGSQVSAETTDMASALAALFALESQVDSTDIAFPDLLGARLSAELALRSTPWEEIRATPRAQEKLADTWPLSAVLSAMRWRPGDAVRLRVPDIGVEDASPRQILQVTRSFAPEGRTGTQVSFRQRPRSAQASMRRLIRAALSPQRSYQGQKVTLIGKHVTAGSIANGAYPAGGGVDGYSIVSLLPQDQVVKALVRISYNSGGNISLYINFADRTSALGGAWGTAPVEIDITAYATQASATDNRLAVIFQNTSGGVITEFDFQLIVEVLR